MSKKKNIHYFYYCLKPRPQIENKYKAWDNFSLFLLNKCYLEYKNSPHSFTILKFLQKRCFLFAVF